MIFDFTDLGSGVNIRHKPRNHISVEGSIYHGDQQVASLRTLVLLYTMEAYDIAGGRFTISWHKMQGPITKPLRLEARIDDDRLEDGVSGRWIVDDLQIIYAGSPIAIGGFNDLLGVEVPFFGKRHEWS